MDKEKKYNLSICICTFKRVDLLDLLLTDISQQTIWPHSIIVVDGDPGSNDVFGLLIKKYKNVNIKIIYLPSNFGNLAYQRYLGWRVADREKSDLLLYFDDDLRISNEYALEKLLEPMYKDNNVLGVTAITDIGLMGELSNQPIFNRENNNKNILNILTKNFGSGATIPPGGLAPSGHRIAPERKSEGFVEVKWLQGRVMLYRMNAISQNSFSDDLFALDHIRCDLGEDTFLSRRVGYKGKMLLGYGLGIEHPNADLPKCYPVEAYHFAYASAYSRRFLNDHYRVFEPPKLSDRIALVKSYLGNSIINWGRAVTSLKKYEFSYAPGYTKGALRGIFQKPTAKNLTPHINWWQDAEEALRNQIIIQ